MAEAAVAHCADIVDIKMLARGLYTVEAVVLYLAVKSEHAACFLCFFDRIVLVAGNVHIQRRYRLRHDKAAKQHGEHTLAEKSFFVKQEDDRKGCGNDKENFKLDAKESIVRPQRT